MDAIGSRIVGTAQYDGKIRGYLWSAPTGVVDLNDHLPSLGLSLSEWKLYSVEDISNNATTITGMGVRNGEKYMAWIVSGLPAEACFADCDTSGQLTIDDFICFQTLYAIGDPTADCDQNGELDIDDFICFQTAFAIGC